MENEGALLIIYVSYIISTCVFLTYLCIFFLERCTKKETAEKSSDKGLFVSSLIQNLFSCIVYSDYMEKYILIPIVIIGVSIIIRLTKHKGIANALCLATSIVFIFITIFIGGNLIIEEPSSHKVKYYDSALTSFNSRFIQYEGDKVTGAQVKALIQQIRASNANPENEDRKINLNLNGKQENDMTKIGTKIINNRRYKVSFEYNERGLVCLAKIEELEDTNNNTVNEVK